MNIKEFAQYVLDTVQDSVETNNTNIETEIAPIVGTKEQAEDLIQYIAGQNVDSCNQCEATFTSLFEQVKQENYELNLILLND